MKILDLPQKSAEWLKARAAIFTASETGEFVAEEKKCRLLKSELQEILSSAGINFDKKATNEDLIALIPDVTPYLSWTESTVKARQNLIAKKLAEPFYSDDRFFGLAGSALLTEIRDRQERRLETDPAIMRGNLLEPLAREAYELKTGHKVTEVGLCVHDDGGFGCSPDGLIMIDLGVNGGGECLHHGLEIKCPIPETHAKYLLSGGLPDEYKPQVHHSMAATGLPRWDFWSFCPGLPSLLVTVHRDEYTERFLAGLLSLSAEMEATRAKLSAMWESRDENDPGVASAPQDSAC